MTVDNAKETFEEFFATFISAIASLDFKNCHKISNLWKTLSEPLCLKMADGTKYTSFSHIYHITGSLTWIFTKQIDLAIKIGMMITN